MDTQWTFSHEHMTAFSMYRSKGFRLDGMSDELLRALAEDRNFAHEIAAHRQKLADEAARAAAATTSALKKYAPATTKAAAKAAAIPPAVPDAEEMATALFETIEALVESGLEDLDSTKADLGDVVRKYAGTGATPRAFMIRYQLTRDALDLALRFIGHLNTAMKQLKAEVKALDARPGFKYWGIWSGARECSPGDFVTHAGSLWHANATTRARPGTGPEFTLVCKRGADGKDGRDAPGAA
jgi:hypothetical protein